jgi:hypothetical protein
MMDAKLWLTMVPTSCLFVIRVTMLIEIACYYYISLFFCKIDIDSEIWTCLFLLLNDWVVWCLSWVRIMYACMLIVCYYFFVDRFERRVCGGGGGLWISRRRRSGTSHPRQAIYLLHIWNPNTSHCMVLLILYIYALFFSILLLLPI